MINLIEQVRYLGLDVIEHLIAQVLRKSRFPDSHSPNDFCFANQRSDD